MSVCVCVCVRGNYYYYYYYIIALPKILSTLYNILHLVRHKHTK